MKIFLRLKHWQLFLLFIALPFLFTFVAAAVFSVANNLSAFMLLPIVFIIAMGSFFGWFWTLGTNLHPKLPKTVKMNLGRFKFFLLFPFVYMVVILLCMFWSFSHIYGNRELDLPISIPTIIIPVHIFATFCMFYILYFVAKEVKAVEWQRPVTFSDYAGEFLLIWFYPLGIWIIQPRINRLFHEGTR